MKRGHPVEHFASIVLATRGDEAPLPLDPLYPLPCCREEKQRSKSLTKTAPSIPLELRAKTAVLAEFAREVPLLHDFSRISLASASVVPMGTARRTDRLDDSAVSL